MAQRGTTAKIDLAELERLSAMQATDEEIAAWFNVTTKTIERRRKKKAFAEVMNRGKAKGRISVRRAQLKLLESGNATMGAVQWWLERDMPYTAEEMATVSLQLGAANLSAVAGLLRAKRTNASG